MSKFLGALHAFSKATEINTENKILLISEVLEQNLWPDPKKGVGVSGAEHPNPVSDGGIPEV